MAQLRRHPRAVRRPLQRDRLARRAASIPNSPSLGQAFPLLPANLKPPIPVTNLGAVRLRARHRDLAAEPDRGAGAPRPPRRERRSARLGPGRRDHADPALRRDVLRLGLEGPRRHGVVPPAAADDRLRRGRRRQREPGAGRSSTCTRPTATTCRSGSGSTPSAPRSAGSACSTRRRRSRSQSDIPRAQPDAHRPARRPTPTTTRTPRARRTTSSTAWCPFLAKIKRGR